VLIKENLTEAPKASRLDLAQFLLSISQNVQVMTTTKNRSETENRIYRAFTNILETEGFAKLGINAIAKQAGVDKNLVYRYFDGLQGLFLRYVEEGDFFPYLDQPDTMPSLERIAEKVTAYARELRAKPGTQEILRSQVTQPHTDATRPLFRYANNRLIASFEDLPVDIVDKTSFIHVITLIIAGIVYLSLMSKHHRYFMNFHLQDEANWTELEALIPLLLKGLTPENTQPPS